MRKSLPLLLLTLALAAAAPAVPPLSPAQKQLLNQTTDGPGFDEAPLYALLQNVTHWPANAQPAAQALDFNALLNHPEQYRGELFHITGIFAGQPKDQSDRVNLAKQGPWGSALTRWGIIVNRHKDQVVVVCFVDPHDQIKPPHSGAPVSVTARFYKRWTTVNLNQIPASFLTFIAAAPSHAAQTAQSPYGPAAVGFVVVLALAGAFIFMLYYLRISRQRAEERKRKDHLRRQARIAQEREEEDEADEDQPPLPERPDDALGELSKRHDDEPHDLDEDTPPREH